MDVPKNHISRAGRFRMRFFTSHRRIKNQRPCLKVLIRGTPIYRCLSLFMVLLFAAAAHATPALIGVYQSETNAATYHQLNRVVLRSWLKTHNYASESFGDNAAADADGLAKYTAIITTNNYLVPDAACLGLSEYVRGGGVLIWIDAPSRSHNPDLLGTLGIEPKFAYLNEITSQFQITKSNVAIAGADTFSSKVVGNAALQATGEVLATFAVSNTKTSKLPPAIPAVVQNSSGSGTALLLNWNIWSGAPQGRELLSGALNLALARQLLETQPAVAYMQHVPDAVEQPQNLTAQAIVLARPEFATKRVSVQARLQQTTAPTAQPVAIDVSDVLALSERKEESYAVLPLNFATSKLPDGDYQIAVNGKITSQKLPIATAMVRLDSQLRQRLRRGQSSRAKLLRPLLTGTLGDYAGAPRTPDGRTDIPKLFKAIAAAHMNSYDFLIYQRRSDWDDFQEFVRQAQQKNIKVWITLLPPSEPPPSAPFKLDYIRWAQEIGKLSQQYSCIAGVVIDDFWSIQNQTLFTPNYIARFAATLHSYNPKLTFLATVYWRTIGDKKFWRDFGSSIDGIMFPYEDVESTQELKSQLKACRRWIGSNKFLFINVYANGSSKRNEKGLRTPKYLSDVLSISHRLCDGIRLYVLPKSNFDDPGFKAVAKLYGDWNRGALPR